MAENVELPEKWYVVSYDLRAGASPSSRDYEALYSALRTATVYCWPLESVWLIRTERTAMEVIDILVKGGSVSEEDGLLVLEITGAGAYRNVQSRDVADFLANGLEFY